MELNYRQIGCRIREERTAAGMSQAVLAEITDTSPQYISHIENARKRASLEIVVRIANALGTSVDQLLAGNLGCDRYGCDAEFNKIIADCNSYEKRIILEIAAAAKTVLKHNDWMLNRHD